MIWPLLLSAALFVVGIGLLRLYAEMPPGSTASLAWRGIFGGLLGGLLGTCAMLAAFSLYVIGAVFPYLVLAPLWGGTAALFLGVFAGQHRDEVLDDADTRLSGATIVCGLMGCLLAVASMLVKNGPLDFITPLFIGALSGVGAGALGANALPPGVSNRERANSV